MEMVLERGPSRVGPNDRAQLAESPVSGRRVLGLFVGDRGRLAVLTVTIVATSVAGLAQPFLVREVIDVALPQQNTTLLIWCVTGMVAVAAVTGLFGVAQTWLATAVGQRSLVSAAYAVSTSAGTASVAVKVFMRGSRNGTAAAPSRVRRPSGAVRRRRAPR